jgi:hypothetical protein
MEEIFQLGEQQVASKNSRMSSVEQTVMLYACIWQVLV